MLVFQRSLTAAKSRLAPVLTSAERSALVRASLERVAMRVGRERCLVLAEDASVGSLAHDLNLEVIEQADCDLNSALRAASDALAGDLLVVPADLPLFELPDTPEGVGAVAPDHHLTGTSALWLPDPHDGFSFSFGPGSLLTHLAALRHHYGDARLMGNRFLLDIDTAEDLVLAATLCDLDPALRWPREIDHLLSPAADRKAR